MSSISVEEISQVPTRLVTTLHTYMHAYIHTHKCKYKRTYRPSHVKPVQCVEGEVSQGPCIAREEGGRRESRGACHAVLREEVCNDCLVGILLHTQNRENLMYAYTMM